MRKQLTKVLSCVMCLAMLWSIAAPVAAASGSTGFEEVALAPDLTLPDEDEALSLEAPATDDNAAHDLNALPGGDPTMVDPLQAELLASDDQVTSTPEVVPINSYSGSDASILFDANWKFNLGDLTGAQNEVYNDASWGTVNLPHDFSIDQAYSSAYEGESGYLPGGVGWYRKSFMVDPSWENKVVSLHFGGAYMDTTVYLNGTKLGENHYGYNPFDFVLPAELLHYSGENVLAIRVANIIPSSRWYSGSGIYRSVYLNVSEQVHVDRYGVTITTQNTGAVTVKTDVRNDGSSAASNVTVKQEIFELDGTTFEKKGAAVASDTSSALTVANGATDTATQNLTVSNPKLWDSWDKGTPNLYLLVTSVQVNGAVVATKETEFGFREMVYDVDRGCSINGTYIKLKGVCQHHDQGGLGAEAWYRALERQVDILMEMGCNSIRVTHNPAADELIEICNRKGILIIDEIFDMWMNTKNGNANDFAKWFNANLTADNQIMGGSSSKTWAQFVVETIAGRDKNAPCVIMYSLGNEINTVCSGPTSGYAPKSLELIAWAKAADPTRPVTLGDNGQATDNSSWQGKINNNIFNNGGVVGHNYPYENSVTRAHNNGWPIYASETVSAINSRGIYKDKNSGTGTTASKRLTSYDKPAVDWGYTAAEGWWRTIRYDYNMGEYVWTGFDYIGEPTPWNGISPGAQGVWPSPKNSFFGIIDTNGIPKDSYYLYRAMWNDTDTTLHLLPTWDEADLELDSSDRAEVVVYSNAPVVRLYLNGKEVGAAKTTDNYAGASHHVYRTFSSAAMKENGTNTFSAGNGKNSLYATFWVPYEEGTLEVKAFANESTNTPMTDTVGRSVVNTTTGAAKLVMSVDRAVIKNDGRDLAYITIDVLDDNDEIVNGAEPEITVSVSGEGRFMALDNGIQPDHTPYSSATRTAGAGRLVAIVQSTEKEGTFTVTATSNGLTSSQLTITTQGAETTVDDSEPVSYTIAKTYYVRRGVTPTLPGSVTVTLGDGSSTTENVVWNSYDHDLLNTVGNEFAIGGTITAHNLPISVSVVVLDEVAALLNYSAAAQVGTVPLLPDTRPAVMADGTVLTAQFPVNWTMPSEKAFNKAGIVTIPGVAQVFGKTLDITAKIRMDEGSVILGSDVSGIADTLTLNGTPSDDLQAIRDDDPSTTWRGSGEPVFYFNTAIGLYQLKITYAGSVPTSGVTLYTSGASNISDAEWTPIEATRTVSGATVTYQLARPGSAVLTKLAFDQEVEVAEVELIVASVTYTQNSTADLDDLKVNGTSATADQMAEKIVHTADATAIAEPVSTRNVASTILPADDDGRILIVTESEDHSTRSLYTVYQDYHELSASDDSNDYPFNKTTASALSQAQLPPATSGDASVNAAVDGDENTFWHSNYQGALSEAQGGPWDLDTVDKRYFQLELEEETVLTALRYKPRPTTANGTVVQYRVDVSTTTDDVSSFKTVCSGDWAHDNTWKIAVFDQPTAAKYVRLYGVHTKGRPNSNDPEDEFMSAAEVRVVTADSRADMSRAVVTVSPTEFQWKNVEIRPGSGSEADQGTTVTVTLDGRTLTKDVDYYLAYSNNSDPGTAYIFAKAMEGSDYKGTASTTFTILKNDAKIVSFEEIVATTQAGIPPTLPDTAWANMSNGSRIAVPVIWDRVPEEYYIYPQQKEYTLPGRVEDEDLLSDPDLRPILTVKVGWSQSVDTVSTVTAAGVFPSLPDAVTVRFTDGTSGVRNVTRWYKTDLTDLSDLTQLTDDHKLDLTAADFAQPGSLQVIGDVSGIDRVKAVVNVRIVAGVPTGNLALNTDSSHTTIPFPMAYRSSSVTVDNPRYLLDGERTGNVGTGKKIWCNWATGVFDDAPWAAVALAGQFTDGSATAKTYVPETKIVNKVRIGFVEEEGYVSTNTSKVMYPLDYTVQYYTGPTDALVFNTTDNGNVRTWSNSPLNNNRNWTTVTPKTTKPAIPDSNTEWVEYEFLPVNAAILRVVLTPQERQWVGVEELEIYGLEAIPNSTFTVESVTLNGIQRLQDFQGSGADKTLEITLAADADIPQLAVRADGNPAIAVTQAARVPGMPEPGGAWAQAVITSEDGSKVETYTVKFTRESAPDSYDITLDGADTDRLTFNAQGGAAGDLITFTAPTGYEATNVLVVITEGDRKGQTVPVSNNSFRMPAASVRFSATVSPIRYTITYYLNGGVDEGGNRHDYNVEIPTFTLRAPTRSGYTFVGWTGSGFTTPTKTVTIQQGSTGDRSYTAVWLNNTPGTTPPSGGGGGGSSQPAGSRVTTTMPNGAVTTVTTAPDGSQNAAVKLPSGSNSVELEMPALVPGSSAETAPTVTINASRPTVVTIPVQDGGNGTIVLRVNADGSETIVPMAAVTKSGLRLNVQNGDVFKIVDNSKTFDDLASNHWAMDAVSFTAGRELFLGLNTPKNFAPNETMSRAMMVTVLWRMREQPAAKAQHRFADVVEGAWYDEAIQWAVEANIAQGNGSGFDPNAPVTREQLAVMLYRAAGSPAVSQAVIRTHTDGQNVSSWAAEAMAWCVENNILNGRDGSALAPQDTASRAEVAAMLMRYIKTSLNIPL